jgi:AcrR family transcriptional regulator
VVPYLILEAAQTLFDLRGIERVTMADITAATGLMRSTIYQYFSSKDEIIWALVQQVLEHTNAILQQTLQGVDGTALATITAILGHLRDELVAHPEKVRFMAQFDALYARDWSAEQLLADDSMRLCCHCFFLRSNQDAIPPTMSGSPIHDDRQTCACLLALLTPIKPRCASTRGSARL